MDMVTFTSPCNANLSKNLSYQNDDNHRDASFSSYLHGSDKTFVIKLAESRKNPTSLNSIPNGDFYIGGDNVEHGEIDVFSAEKYFNERVDEESPRKSSTKHQHEEDKAVEVKAKPQSGTPSVRSESSWNSQNALLQSVPRNQPLVKAKGRRFLSGLGCNCYCSDKKSVDIDEHIGEKSSTKGKAITKQSLKAADLVQSKKIDELGNDLNKGNYFSFPVINSMTGNQGGKLQLQETDESMEGFGYSILEKGKRRLSLDRRTTTSMLSWDAITPRMERIEIPTSSNGMIYNDAASDASSDLFEIDSFSNTNPTTCYAPSEASIEWSVVTGSVADFSVMSDSEELRTISTNTGNPYRMALNSKTSTRKEMENRRTSILSGCKSHKDVRVAEDAYRRNDKANPEPIRHERSNSFVRTTRFQGESKVTGFDSRNRQHTFDTRSFSRSQSPHLLYIQ